MLTPQNKQLGVTAVELLIAVAILAIASAIAAPSYNGFVANTQIRSTTESIRNGLQVARAEAVKRNATVAFTLNTADTSWVVGCPVVSANCPATIQTKAAREGGAATVTVAITGTNTISFTNLGNITAAGGQMSIVDVDNTSVPATRSNDLRIRIGAGGNIRVCDPNIIETTDVRFCSV
jgi:type IV fimbrial biogenesis protein FimT